MKAFLMLDISQHKISKLTFVALWDGDICIFFCAACDLFLWKWMNESFFIITNIVLLSFGPPLSSASSFEDILIERGSQKFLNCKLVSCCPCWLLTGEKMKCPWCQHQFWLMTIGWRWSIITTLCKNRTKIDSFLDIFIGTNWHSYTLSF